MAHITDTLSAVSGGSAENVNYTFILLLWALPFTTMDRIHTTAILVTDEQECETIKKAMGKVDGQPVGMRCIPIVAAVGTPSNEEDSK